MFEILPIPAFQDNYIWLIRNGQYAAVVDPGEAAPVIQLIKKHKLILEAIFVTHHHNDHIGGIPALLSEFEPKVYAPSKGQYDFAYIGVGEDTNIYLEGLDLTLTVIETPGHTLDHIAYFSDLHDGQPVLFCGDTLFSCGCGRLFEGTPLQLHTSLRTLAKLPATTLVYPAHEYTLSNIEFALTVDPRNIKLQEYKDKVADLRAKNQPSLPSVLAIEQEINPFLRCDSLAIQQNLGISEQLSTVEIFSILRELKNKY
jgi:hydroxyacylglutathione hydrolase